MKHGSRSLSLLGGASLSALLVAPHASWAQDTPPPTPPPNRPPVVADASLVVDEDTKGTGALRASDPDGDALRFRVTKGATLGAVVLDEQKGTFEYTPRQDVHGDDAFEVEVSDGELQASATVKVVVRPRNDPPVATGAAVELVEDSPVSGAFAVSDVEGDRLYFAIATEPRNGSVTITDPAKGAFQYTPRKDFHGDDAFVFEVGDGKLAARAEIKLKVTPVNDAPTVEGAALRTREEQAVEGQVRARDVEGDALTFRVARAPAHGAVEVLDATTGRLRYTPERDFHGEDRFTVAVSDAEATSSAEVTVRVEPVNDAPVASLLTLSLDEDATGEGTLSATDVDGDKLSYRVVRGARLGEATVDGVSGRVRYRPRPDVNGADDFAIEVSDGSARVPVEVRVQIAARNDAPVTKALALSTLEDKPVDGQVVASDVDGDALSYALTRRPTHGELTLDAKTGAVRYVPRPDFFGEDAFTVEVSDGSGRTKADGKVVVAPVNDPPVLPALALTGAEDAVASGTLAARDPEGDALRFRLLTRPRHGEAVVDEATGGVRYTPRKDWHGEDAFRAEVSDGRLATSADVSVRVTPVNDPPVATGGAFRTREDEPVELRVSASDVDGGALSFRVARAPRQGTVEVLDAKAGRFRYTPRADFHGEDAVTVAVSDGQAEATATLTVSVTPVNDAPVAERLSLRLDEDGAVEGTLTARDVDGDALTYRIVRGPTSGEASVVDASRGDLRYRPRPNFFGSDAFTVEVSDGNARVQAEVALTVAPVNDAPVARDLALKTAEDTVARGRITASDIDGDALRYRVATPPRMGTAEIEAETGALRYTPAADQSGEDSFVVEVSDGTASARARVDVEVLRVPDPPRVGDARFETREDEAVTVRLPVTDPDGDRLTFRLTSPPKRGEAALEDATLGRLRYTPRPDANGEDEVGLEVSDGRHTVKLVARFDVAPVNDPPSVKGLTIATDEDNAVSARLEGHDVDGDALVFRVHKAPPKGRVTFDEREPRRFVFEPALNQNGTVRFEVVAFDGTVASPPATVEVRIRGVNDAPVIPKGQRVVTDEDSAFTGTLRAEDGDGEPLLYRILRQPARGTVKLDDPKTGRFTFTPNRDVFGSDSFAFAVTDPNGATANGLVQVKVEEVDDPPVAMREYTDAPKYGRVTRKLKGFDPEGKPVTFRIVKQPRVGRVELRDEASGEYVFITDGSGGGTVEFEFVANDGRSDSVPAAVVVRVR